MNEHKPDGTELLSALESIADEMWDGLRSFESPVDEAYARAAYVAFYVKAYRVFRAISLLLRQGLEPEAEMLLRPFFETIVDWWYIETSPVILGERYILHQAAVQLQFWRNRGLTDKVATYVAEYGDTVKDFCSKYNIKRNRPPRNWCGVDFEQKAKEAGLSNYSRIYGYHSDLLHNSPYLLPKYMDTTSDGHFVLKTQPEYDNLRPTLSVVCLFFAQCLEKASNTFVPDARPRVQEIKDKVHLYAADAQ